MLDADDGMPPGGHKSTQRLRFFNSDTMIAGGAANPSGGFRPKQHFDLGYPASAGRVSRYHFLDRQKNAS